MSRKPTTTKHDTRRLSIDIEKSGKTSTDAKNTKQYEKNIEKEKAIRDFLQDLENPADDFNSKKTFEKLLKYIKMHDRIIYSTISAYIYAKYRSGSDSEISGTVLSNLDSLSMYCEEINSDSNSKNQYTDSAIKSVYKIRDHINLASQQYTMLRQSDDEYSRRFNQLIEKYKQEMTKEMNTQMIAMVGIFTALAFLIFGSISSLDGVFENMEFPLFKIMSVGVIWGICVLNMIFIFMFCIGKMTKTSPFNDNRPGNIFQRYPIVWWTNLLLIGLLMFTSWGYFIQQSAINDALVDIVSENPLTVFWIGNGVILLLLIVSIVFLARKIGKKSNNTKGPKVKK